MTKTIDVLSMGTMYVDLNIYDVPIGQGLQPNTEVVGGTYEYTTGGSALNFAKMCRSLDLKTAFIGKTGIDAEGKRLESLVKDSGIIPAFIQSSSVQTSLSVNQTDQTDTTSHIMTVGGNANQSLTPDDVQSFLEKHLPSCSYLYFGGCFKLKQILPELSRFAQLAHTFGTKVVLDHGRITNLVSDNDKKLIRDLIPEIDIYLPSREEFLTVWNAQSIDEALQMVRQYSNAQIIVKDAENGAISFDNKQSIQVPSFTVEVYDVTGAGDSFNAGFIKAKALGKSMEESMRFACATAALKISQKELPTVAGVNAFLNQF
jgi:ribokinase